MIVRTRMAPSPTGEYHIGHIRTVLYNYAFSKKMNGKFLIRIEDTDRNRYVDGATERILDVIGDFGLTWDEGPRKEGNYGPYIQSERLDLYSKYANQLIRSGAAYHCFCSPERLDQLREEQQKAGLPVTKYDKKCLGLSSEEIVTRLSNGEKSVIRLNVPKDRIISFNDVVYGQVQFNSNDIDDQILLKSDGYPSYHLAVVVDDNLMEITHVMRGNDWLPSTPKHVLLYEAFGWTMPTYIHLPNLKELGSTKKLSKRFGPVHAIQFLEEGYLPKALLNFLMLLGWNSGTDKEIYSLEEFIAEFSLERIHKTDLVAFDREKLLWYNGYYIRSMSPMELQKQILDWAKKFNVVLPVGFDDKESVGIIGLIQERLKKLSEINELVSYFYEDPKVDLKTLLSYTESKERAKSILTSFFDLFSKNLDWDIPDLDLASHKLIEEMGFKPKEAFMTLRVAVSGTTATPQIFDTLFYIGKDKVLNRITHALNLIDSN